MNRLSCHAILMVFTDLCLYTFRTLFNVLYCPSVRGNTCFKVKHMTTTPY